MDGAYFRHMYIKCILKKKAKIKARRTLETEFSVNLFN